MMEQAAYEEFPGLVRASDQREGVVKARKEAADRGGPSVK